MSEQRQIQSTPEGDEIILNPANRFGAVFIQLIWVIGTFSLFYWAAPSILTYFRTGKISGALTHLESFHWSPMWMKAAIIVFCIFVAWWSLGGIYQIVNALLKRGRFLLRSDAIIVQRRGILTREVKIFSYEPMALRLRSLDGAIEAKTSGGAKVLSDCGTGEDRKWLLELLQQRYHAPTEVLSSENAKERVGTYIVEKLPGGVLRITSSGLSTIGCGIIAAVVCAGLIALSIWLFAKGSGGAFAPLLFAVALGFGGLSALNTRMVEASRGKLRVHWSNPVRKLLKRFVTSDNVLLKYQFGEGSFERDTGTLRIKVTRGPKGSTNYGVVLIQKPLEREPEQGGVIGEKEEEEEKEDEEKEEELSADSSEEEDPDEEDMETPPEEDLVLDIHGEGSEYNADYLVRVLSEATGFPTVKWRF